MSADAFVPDDFFLHEPGHSKPEIDPACGPLNPDAPTDFDILLMALAILLLGLHSKPLQQVLFQIR